MAAWDDHIVGLERKSPGELNANPQNWRRHPDAQRSTMAAAFDEVGKVAPLIENLRSVAKGWPAGEDPVLLDGHLRLELALEHGEESLPVVVVDLTKRQEQLALATLDPIGTQAEADPELLNALLEAAPPESPDLGALLAFDDPGDEKFWNRMGDESKPKRKDIPVTIKILVSQVEEFEAAVDAAMVFGAADRGDALMKICQAYVKKT